MSFTVTPVETGRGAWTTTGGTLNLDGTAPGPYYKAPKSGAFTDMPGAKAVIAKRTGGEVNLNDYAVHMGVRAIQRRLGVADDGVWGPNTDQAAKTWQKEAGLTADGVVGPKTTRAMFRPLLNKLCNNSATLFYATRGHVGHESSWDPAAVGYSTPEDLGLCQINGPAHPDMTADERLTPESSLLWVTGFVAKNIETMGNLDDGIAAYLLGIGGARRWVAAGRPRIFANTDVSKYILAVHLAADL